MSPEGRAVCCEIDCGETNEMSVHRNGFVHRFADRWVQQHALGAVRQRIAPTCLGTEISVDLVNVSASQRRLAPPARSYDPGELGIDYDAPRRHHIVEHNIGLHARQNVPTRQVFDTDAGTAWCPSSYKMGHQSGLSIGGSGSFA